MIDTNAAAKPLVQNWNEPGFLETGISVDVLRLDLLHPTISGNKWLKLKGYLQKATTENKAGIITKGGPWSNHAHACAYACKAFGLSCELWIKGHEKLHTPTLEDCTNWGAKIRFINRQAFYDEPSAQLYADDNNLLYIALGGAGETGIESVTEYITNLNLPAYTQAICSVGTATTLAGLAFVQNNFTQILGIESGTKDEQLNEKIIAWQQQLPEKKLQLLHNFSFGGYSKYNTELVDFMNELYLKHGIPTDIVYTAKLFYAVAQLATQSYFEANSKLLIIHSGGLQGNRSLPHKLLQF
jgi:1-aminocyclopropane-1-carboxylate deaminase